MKIYTTDIGSQLRQKLPKLHLSFTLLTIKLSNCNYKNKFAKWKHCSFEKKKNVFQWKVFMIWWGGLLVLLKFFYMPKLQWCTFRITGVTWSAGGPDYLIERLIEDWKYLESDCVASLEPWEDGLSFLFCFKW